MRGRMRALLVWGVLRLRRRPSLKNALIVRSRESVMHAEYALGSWILASSYWTASTKSTLYLRHKVPSIRTRLWPRNYGDKASNLSGSSHSIKDWMGERCLPIAVSLADVYNLEKGKPKCLRVSQRSSQQGSSRFT